MSDASGLCPGCFLEPLATGPCPGCGFDGETEFHTVLQPGTVLADKYEVGSVLGQPGGFGVTYLTYDLRLQRRVALKELMPRELVARDRDGATLHPHSRSDEDLFRYTLESFLNEARMVAKFSHPNLVRVLDYFEANGTAYFAMEFYEGRTLAEVVKERGPLTGAEAVEVAEPLLEALEEVHAAGILHRDIKPTNIYLTAGGRPVLLDFGAARLALGERSRALTSVLTPGYAPFEQYHGEGNQGPWTDVYGVAATLYFLVTGQGPPEAGARMQAGQMVVPPRELAPDLPETVATAIVKGLALEPRDRPGTARAFLALLTGAAPPAEDATAVWTPAGGGADATVVATGSAGTTGVAGTGASGAGDTGATVVAGEEAGAAGPPGAPARRASSAEAAPPAPAGAAAPEEGGGRKVSSAWLGAAAATVVIALSVPLAASYFGGSEPAEPGTAAEESAAGTETAGDPGAEPDPSGEPDRPGTATASEDGPEGEVAAAAGATDPAPAGSGGSGESQTGGERTAATGERSGGAVADAPTESREPAAAAPAPTPAPANGVAVLVFGEAGAVRSAETVILGAMTGPGSELRPVDAGTLQMMRGEGAAVQRALAGDLSALAEIGSRRGVEFLVVGDLAASAEPTVGRFWGASADLDLRLYRVSTGALAETRTFRAGGDQLVAGTSESDALRKATEQVGQQAAAAVRRWIRNATR